NALRQVTVKRGLDVRDFTLTTFGGSGSLLLCRLMDILGIPTVLVPPNPGNVSAFGLLTVDVKNDYVQTHVSLAERLAGYVETPVVQRSELAPGTTVVGPVIVEEFGSTVPIHPGFEVRVDDYLNLIVTRHSSGSDS